MSGRRNIAGGRVTVRNVRYISTRTAIRWTTC